MNWIKAPTQAREVSSHPGLGANSRLAFAEDSCPPGDHRYHLAAHPTRRVDPAIQRRIATRSSSGKIHAVELSGPAGRLEAVLNSGSPDAPCAALVCHPHPSFGGTLHNKVVYHAMKALNDPKLGLSLPVLRFNFRGAGLSEGSHDGSAETGDVLAAMDWLRHEFGLPLIVAGFSFGAAMMLRACSLHPESARDVRALAAIGLPLAASSSSYEYPFLKDQALPKLFLGGDRDQFAPAAQLRQIVSTAAEPRRLIFIPGADHFFTGHLTAMQIALAAWLKELHL